MVAAYQASKLRRSAGSHGRTIHPNNPKLRKWRLSARARPLRWHLLGHSPLHARRHISHGTPARVWWMFIELGRSWDPGNTGELSSECILRELVRGELVPSPNTSKILKGVSSVVSPSQIAGLKAQWKRGGDPGGVSGFRVVYEGRVGSNEHQMVRRRRPGNIGEILVVEREFSSIGKVGGYVSLDELLTDQGGLAG